MNAIPYSTRAPVAHDTCDIHPDDMPQQYAIVINGSDETPEMACGEKQVFSTVIPPATGDIVALWFKPGIIGNSGHQLVAFRLIKSAPAWAKFNWNYNPDCKDDPKVVVKTLRNPRQLTVRINDLSAIHTWVAPLPEDRATIKYMPHQQVREAHKEAVAMSQNDLTLFTGPAGDEPLTMSSREIMDLLGSRHDNVKVTIERLAAKGVIPSPAMQDFKNINGVTGKEYRLDKRSSLIVVAQLSPEFTAKVVDRWQELEGALKQPAKPAASEFPIPQTFAEALMLAANQAAQIEHGKAQIAEKNAQIADMREDVEALDRIAGADDLFGLRETVAMLQTTQNKFVAWLQRNGWAYRQTGSKRLLAYADKRKAGYATNKARVYEKPDGSEGIDETLKFTPAGIVKLAKLLNVTLEDGDLWRLHGGRKDEAA